ncbi:MAG: DUF4292 domain-containing protein [Bdellovibrionota bacterium]
MKTKLKNYLTSLMLIVLVACAAPVQKMQPASISNQDDFIRQVQAHNPKIQTLKGKARIEVKTKDKTYRFKAGIMMNKDGYMFVETYGFGIPQGYASLFDDRLTVVFPGDKKMYLGSSSSTLTRLMRINVSFQELFDPILRKIPMEMDTAKPKVQMTSDGYVVTDTEKTKFYYDANQWLTKVERHAGFLVEYGQPWNRKMDYPKSVRLSYEYQSISITYDDLTVNEPVANEAFQLNIPTDGFAVESID